MLHNSQVIHVVEGDRVRVVVCRVPLLEPLPDVGHAPAGHRDVREETDEHEALDPRLVEHGANLVPEEHHARVLLVVLGVVRIVWVDAARHEETVQRAALLGQTARRDRDAGDESVPVLGLVVARVSKHGAKESAVPHVDEGHGDAGVEAEYADAGEGGDGADHETHKVGR